MEVVDQEMAVDEASQSTALAEDTPLDAPLPPPDGDDAATAWTCLMFVYLFSLFFFVIFFLGAWCVLGFLILLLEQCFYSKLRTMFSLPGVYGSLIIMLKQCWLLVVLGPTIILVILHLLVYFLALHDTLWLHVIFVYFVPLVIILYLFIYFRVSNLHPSMRVVVT